jgi:dipeptidyl aminopeptidase/acylaminoacyl peptidase
MGELSAEAVVDRIVPRRPRVSPDGRWVVYTTAAGGRPGGGLWLVPADGSAPPRELAAGREPRWAPDSASVCFLEDARPHRIGLTGDAHRLTDRAVTACVPLPGGLVLLIAPGEAPERDPYLRHSTPPDRLWLLDPATGDVRPHGDLGDRHVVEVAPHPGGGPLAVLTWPTGDIHPGALEPRLHLVGGPGLPAPAIEASSPVWWPDGAAWRLAYLGRTPPGLIGGDAVFDAELGTNLTAGMSECPFELVQVDDGPPLALFAEGLGTTIRRLDPATGTFAEIARAPGSFESLSHGGGVIAVVASTATEPDDVHAGPAAGPLTRLTDSSPALRATTWGPQERLSYRAEDGLELDGLLVLPPGTTRRDGPFPLVTVPHGGPHGRYADRFLLAWALSARWLAAAGFAVFLPNPRGGVGHGHAFAESVAGEVGGAEWTDILTGIDVLVEAGVADPGRLGVGGWSHGGFLAAWAAARSDRFAAAIVGAGISDWGMMVATAEEGPFEAALGGSTGWEGAGPHRHDRNSPISYAADIRTPILLLHGEDDTNVPLSQAEFLHRALRHFGVEHEFAVYPGENHSLRDREHQLDVLRRTREWFTRWLGPA